jgi:hypothetical protein
MTVASWAEACSLVAALTVFTGTHWSLQPAPGGYQITGHGFYTGYTPKGAGE